MNKIAPQRRLAAILVADLVGYSGPKGIDKVATLQRLRQHRDTLRERISSHGGRVVNTSGDLRLSLVLEDIPISKQMDINHFIE